MKHYGVAHFPLFGFFKSGTAAQTTFTRGRRGRPASETYHLRRLFDRVLFRRQYATDEEHTFFLNCSLTPKQSVSFYHEDDFHIQVRAKQYGRFVAYQPEQFASDYFAESGWFPHYIGLALFLLPDGTGWFQEQVGTSDAFEDDVVPFVWNWGEESARSTSDVLKASYSDLQAVCAKVFVTQVWPHMRDPFPSTHTHRNRPIKFLRGNEGALRRLTRIACFATPELYSGPGINQKYFLTFTGARRYLPGEAKPQKKQDLSGSVCFYDTRTASRQVMPDRLHVLCKAIFQANLFTGGLWEYKPPIFAGGLRGISYPPARRNQKRFAYCQFSPQSISIPIPPPPTAHERTEGFAELADWLDGKMPPEEIRALMGIDPLT